jgi:LysM repeat protein
MTERGSAPDERATACPFVAFEDDRDERSERPDHRHRCYAELRPSPRAIAHQEAYCLSTSFPACPTFQDWARREAAWARRAEEAAAGMAAAAGVAAGADPNTELPEPDLAAPAVGSAPTARPSSEEPWADDGRLFRPRPTNRKWAAPPPWADGATGAAGGAGAASAAAASSIGGAASSAGAGAAASDGRPAVPPEATGLASSRWLDDGSGGPGRARPARDADAPGFLAGRTPEADDDAAPGQELAAVAPPARRPVARDAAGRSAAADARSMTRRPVVGQARPVSQVEHDDGTPSWERPRRFEAYPTLKRRVGMPTMSRLAIGVIAVLVAAALLFTLPALFFGGANQEARTTPSTTAAASSSATPAAPAAPSPLTYTVKPGDTLARIATKYGVTQKQIMAVNPTIKDPDKIVIGQVIIIPSRGPSDVIESAPSASPPPSG